MENFDFAIQNMSINNDNGTFARFYAKYVKTGKMRENGLPEFNEKLYIEIRTRFDQDIVEREADERDIRRFAAEYNFYLAKKERIKKGTPLNQFSFLNVPQLEACELRGICTVEDLAAITEQQALDLGLTDEKKCAERFLEISKNNADIAKYVEENEKLKAKIVTLEEKIKLLEGNS